MLFRSYSLTGLTAGIYSFDLQLLAESLPPPNNNSRPVIESSRVSFIITSSSTYTLEVISATTCGNNNGIIRSDILLNGQISSPNPFFNFSSNISLYKGNELYLTASGGTLFSFSNLSADYYYSTYVDSCGCSSTSNSVIISQSIPINFGLYKVNNPACLINSGRIVVTGVTGQEPYTYLWTGNVSGQTGSTVTGLTTGTYSVRVSDSNFCSKTLTESILSAPTLKFVTTESSQPSCSNSDGSITFYFEGGAAPFFYQLNNGQSQYSLSNQITFTGLPSGVYTCTVNDVGLCTASGVATLLTPQSFSVVSLNSTPASCNILGSVNMKFNGGVPPYEIGRAHV